MAAVAVGDKSTHREVLVGGKAGGDSAPIGVGPRLYDIVIGGYYLGAHILVLLCVGKLDYYGRGAALQWRIPESGRQSDAESNNVETVA